MILEHYAVLLASIQLVYTALQPYSHCIQLQLQLLYTTQLLYTAAASHTYHSDMTSLAQNEDGQTMILAALLVQMMNPRCQRLYVTLYMELDEGLVHRDAMNAHQECPESVLRHPNPAILGAFTGLWTMVAECQFARPRSWRNLRLPRGACRSSCNRRFSRQ